MWRPVFCLQFWLGKEGVASIDGDASKEQIVQASFIKEATVSRIVRRRRLIAWSVPHPVSADEAGPDRVEGALMNLGNKKPVMASFAGNARSHVWKRRSTRLSLPQKYCHKNKLGRPPPGSAQKTLTGRRPAPRPPVPQTDKEQVRARVPHASQPKRHKGTLSSEIGCGREPHDSLAKYSMVDEEML